MQLNNRTLISLVLLAWVFVMAASASETKIVKCCTEISKKNSSAPITGYRIQKKNLPCVRAVVFQTTDGEICRHWGQPWVMEKVKQLEQERRAKKTTPSPKTTGI